MPHTEVPVKVNAWVDQGVAELVAALNEVNGVVTLDSCECDPAGEAHVYFTTHGDGVTLFDAAAEVSEGLKGADDCEAVVAVEWWYGSATPTGRLRCRPADVPAVAERLLSYARTNPSSSDRTCRDTRSSTGRRFLHD